jgi:hypothetical protein
LESHAQLTSHLDTLARENYDAREKLRNLESALKFQESSKESLQQQNQGIIRDIMYYYFKADNKIKNDFLNCRFKRSNSATSFQLPIKRAER